MYAHKCMDQNFDYEKWELGNIQRNWKKLQFSLYKFVILNTNVI